VVGERGWQWLPRY